MANWAKTLANELGPHNITVNNVLPGATNTGRLKEIIKSKAQKLNIGEKDIEEQMASQVPLKRIAEPDEVANAVLFLASSKACIMTFPTVEEPSELLRSSNASRSSSKYLALTDNKIDLDLYPHRQAFWFQESFELNHHLQ